MQARRQCRQPAAGPSLPTSQLLTHPEAQEGQQAGEGLAVGILAGLVWAMLRRKLLQHKAAGLGTRMTERSLQGLRAHGWDAGGFALPYGVPHAAPTIAAQICMLLCCYRPQACMAGLALNHLIQVGSTSACRIGSSRARQISGAVHTRKQQACSHGRHPQKLQKRGSCCTSPYSMLKVEKTE